MEEITSLTPVPAYEEVDGLRRDIADLFLVYDTTLDYPDPDYVRWGSSC
ncbi:MAG: hypothetical protein R3C44_21055 [Chloroflexota bacterium]